MNLIPTLRYASIIFIYCCTAASAAEGDSLSALVDTLFEPMNNPDTPGAAVLVIRDGTVLHRKGYGSANLEHQIPITPTSVFDIASVSKQFTGMAISMLVEKGMVDPDADIRDYIPELPDFGRTVTVRHLVHHTSGIRDWPGTLAVAGWRMDDVISFDQILAMAYRQKELNFNPGERYLYSNTGYNLLAEVVARVTGMTFREWMHENLFVPLGMNDTHIQDNHTELVPHRVYGYDYEDGDFLTITNGLTALGSSSLFTTIDDLGAWVTNFDSHEIGGSAVLNRMQDRGVLNNGDTIEYAYGISVGEYRGARTISHTGAWGGFQTIILHFPDTHFSVIILSNYAGFHPSRPAYRIAELYLGDILAPFDSEDNPESEAIDSVTVDMATLEKYVGTYKLGPGWFVEITRDGEHMTAQATRESSVPMVAVSHEEFFVPAYNAVIRFRRSDAGEAEYLEYRGIEAPRVERADTAANGLREFEGRYYSEELETSYDVEVRDGVLTAIHHRHIDVELQPVARNEFAGNRWFASGVQFLRDDKGAVTAMLISNGRSLNNEFRRVAD